MTFLQYLRVIRYQWLLVSAITLLVLGAAVAVTRTSTPVYRADAQLFVSTSGRDTDLSQLSQGGNFTQQRVKSYADLVTSPTVLEPVIAQLQLAYTVDELAANVSASTPLDTVLLNISVNDTSAARAADIANAIALQFPKLVSSLETPVGQAASPVKVSVTDVATAPQTPVSPRVTLNLLLGILAGFGLGVGVALARNHLDRSISSPAGVQSVVQAPVLGTVGDDSSVKTTPLIIEDLFSPRAESFRQMRTNIRFLSVDTALRSFVVTGSVPEEGKTTTAANLAITLAQAGEKVVLIDGDLRRPMIAETFGLSNGVGLTSVLVGDAPLPSAVQTWRADLPLRILTSGPLPPNPSELLGSDRLVELIQILNGQGATVIFDSPPLLPVTDAAILARVTGGAVVVTRVGKTQTDQLAGAVQTLHNAGASVLGVVLNRVPKRGRNSTYDSYSAHAAYAPAAPAAPKAEEPRYGRNGTVPAASAPQPTWPAQPQPMAAPQPQPATTAPGGFEFAAPGAWAPPPGGVPKGQVIKPEAKNGHPGQRPTEPDSTPPFSGANGNDPWAAPVLPSRRSAQRETPGSESHNGVNGH